MKQKEKLAIIVPYRNRKEHLNVFLPYMEEYLKDYDFKIFIVEQGNTHPFNRGKLINIGVAEAKDYDYFVFHDIDMLPDPSDYSFQQGITHLSTYIEEYNWGLPHKDCMGGVLMCDRDVFGKINGFSNEFWGWGDEDNEIFDKCVFLDIPINRRPGRYSSLDHEHYSHFGLQMENQAYRHTLKDRYINGTFKDGYSFLKYKKISETKISEHGAMVRVTFDIEREIKATKWSLLIKDVRFKLAPYKRAVLGLLKKK